MWKRFEPGADCVPLMQRSEAAPSAGRRGAYAASRAIAIRALAALGLAVLLASFTPLVPWYAARLAGAWTDAPGDILIVLGGDSMGWRSDGFLGLNSYWRSIGAMYAYRQGHFRQVVISGAGVAVLIRDFLIFEGVPAASIQVETGSYSTRENAVFVARLLAGQPGRKVLLTSDYHMWRARRAFARAGLEVRPWPVPDAQKGGWRHRWPAFLDEVVETAKIGYYFCRRWI